MKKCTKCSKIKDLSGFYLRKDSGRYRSKCKLCMFEDNKAYRRNNKPLTKKINNKWESKNRDKVKTRKREYRRENRGLMNYYASRYRAQKLKATPRWLSDKQELEIQSIYKNCPEGHHVDHIVPLQGKEVSGLHVPWNLQYLPAKDNLSKGNKLYR